jgi:hypothetical protein
VYRIAGSSGHAHDCARHTPDNGYRLRLASVAGVKEILNTFVTPAKAGVQIVDIPDDSLRSPRGPPSGRSTRLALLSGLRGMTNDDLIRLTLIIT